MPNSMKDVIKTLRIWTIVFVLLEILIILYYQLGTGWTSYTTVLVLANGVVALVFLGWAQNYLNIFKHNKYRTIELKISKVTEEKKKLIIEGKTKDKESLKIIGKKDSCSSFEKGDNIKIYISLFAESENNTYKHIYGVEHN